MAIALLPSRDFGLPIYCGVAIGVEIDDWDSADYQGLTRAAANTIITPINNPQ
jgi:hypothetical protein